MIHTAPIKQNKKRRHTQTDLLWNKQAINLALPNRSNRKTHKDQPITGNRQSDGYILSEKPYPSIRIEHNEVVAVNPFYQDQIITPIGGMIFRTKKGNEWVETNPRIRLVDTHNNEQIILIPYETPKSGFGIGHLCRTTTNPELANAKEIKIEGNIRIVATKHIASKDNITVLQNLEDLEKLKQPPEPEIIQKPSKPNKKQKSGRQNTMSSYLKRKIKNETTPTTHHDVKHTNPFKLRAISERTRARALLLMKHEHDGRGHNSVTNNRLKGLQPDCPNPKDSYMSGLAIDDYLNILTRHAKEYREKTIWALNTTYGSQILNDKISGDKIDTLFKRYKAETNNETITNITDVDLILIPVNLEHTEARTQHWILICIDNKDKTMGPQISILDSKRNNTLEGYRQRNSWTEKVIKHLFDKNSDYYNPGTNERAQQNWDKLGRQYGTEAQQQGNGTDCGIMLCIYAAGMVFELGNKQNPLNCEINPRDYRYRLALDIHNDRPTYTLHDRNRNMIIEENATDLTTERHKRKRYKHDTKIKCDSNLVKEHTRNGDRKTLFIIQTEHPWPFGLAETLETNNKGDITKYQWYTSIPETYLQSHGIDHINSPKQVDPEKPYLPCWHRDNRVTTLNRQPEGSVPYQNDACDPHLGKTDILIQGFNLTAEGYIPEKTLHEISRHSQIWWRLEGQAEDEPPKDLNDHMNTKRQAKSKINKDKINANTCIESGTIKAIKQSHKEIIPKVIEDCIDHFLDKNIFVCKQVENIMRKHLHLTQTLNTNAMIHTWGTTWCSSSPMDQTLGAVDSKQRLAFLTNKATWVNYSSSDKVDTLTSLIEETYKSILQSKGRTRVALLLSTELDNMIFNRREPLKKGIRTFSILQIDVWTVNMQKIHYDRSTSKITLKEEKNSAPLTIRIIEGEHAPKIDINRIWKDSQEENIIAKQPEKLDIPYDRLATKPHEVFTTTLESENQLWPTHAWYRKSLKLREEEKQEEGGKYSYIHAHSQLAKHDNLLGLLGILPKNFEKHLAIMGIDWKTLNKENTTHIKKIILDASLEAYRRYELWKRLKKYSYK